jgi:hypothetical protein
LLFVGRLSEKTLPVAAARAGALAIALRVRDRTWQGYFFQPAYISTFASLTNTGSIRSIAEITVITNNFAIHSLGG